jgi:FlaA1/EpsC-like NDP-sugar epimerase
MQKIKVIITGATGMIGESVTDTCIKDERIEKLVIINKSQVDWFILN